MFRASLHVSLRNTFKLKLVVFIVLLLLDIIFGLLFSAIWSSLVFCSINLLFCSVSLSIICLFCYNKKSLISLSLFIMSNNNSTLISFCLQSFLCLLKPLAKEYSLPHLHVNVLLLLSC